MKSKKGMALLALLGTAEKGERSRAWLQQKLWGSRELSQAQASLRRELANLRQILGEYEDCLTSDKHSVRLCLDSFSVDVRADTTDRAKGEFLEGIDIRGEEDFEDWLRDMRAQMGNVSEARRNVSAIRGEWVMGHSNESDTREGDFFAAQYAPDATSDGYRNVLEIRRVGGSFTLPEDEPALQQLTLQLIADAGRYRWIPIVASSGVGAQTGGESNARYVLESEVVRSGRNAVLSLTLLEKQSATVLWSDSESILTSLYDPAISKILSRVVNMLSEQFDRAEQRRVIARKSGNMSLADIVWRARYHLQKFTGEDMAVARKLIQDGLGKDPHLAELLMLRAHLTIWEHWLRRAPADQCDDLVPLARAALRADPADARGPLFMGVIETWRRNTPQAIRYLERSCELNPALPAAYTHLGAAYYLNGEPLKSIPALEHSLYLSPMDPFRFFILGEMATAQYLVGNHAEALRLAREAQLTHPNYVLTHILETNALVAMNRMGEARAAWQQLLAARPDLYEGMLTWIPFRDPKWQRKMRFGCEMLAEQAPCPNRTCV